MDVAARLRKLVEVLKPAVASGLPERIDYRTQCGALCRSADPALPTHQEQLLRMQHNVRAVWSELVHRAKQTQRARGAPDLLLVSTVRGRHHCHVLGLDGSVGLDFLADLRRKERGQREPGTAGRSSRKAVLEMSWKRCSKI